MIVYLDIRFRGKCRSLCCRRYRNCHLWTARGCRNSCRASADRHHTWHCISPSRTTLPNHHVLDKYECLCCCIFKTHYTLKVHNKIVWIINKNTNNRTVGLCSEVPQPPTRGWHVQRIGIDWFILQLIIITLYYQCSNTEFAHNNHATKYVLTDKLGPRVGLVSIKENYKAARIPTELPRTTTIY